jgi:hypothetical protein
MFKAAVEMMVGSAAITGVAVIGLATAAVVVMAVVTVVVVAAAAARTC